MNDESNRERPETVGLSNSKLDLNAINEPSALKVLTDSQRKSFEALRVIISADSTLNEAQKRWCDDMCLCRYLRARQFDLPKTEAMLRATLIWRQENKIDQMRCEEVESQIVKGHMYNYGYDKLNRPIVVLRVHTERDPHDNDQKLRFMIYSMERAIRIMNRPVGVEKMVWIVSAANYNFKYNGEVGFARVLLNVLQDQYPERLGMLIVVDPPFLFQAFWKMVYPFIDAETKRKILFVSGNTAEKRKIISEFIDLALVQKDLFGGDSPYVFDGKAYLQMLQQEEAVIKPPLQSQ